jgi:outer membrane protein assembly factor BamB
MGRFSGSNKSAWMTIAGVYVMALAGGWSDPEWSQFRGSAGAGRSGVATFPTEWTEKNVLWKVEIGGPGDSSASVRGELCYLLRSNADGTKRFVQCRRISDGEMVWEFGLDFDTHPKHQKNSYATSTVATAEEGIYASFGSPTRFVVVALDPAGKQRWIAELGPFVSQHGPGASPIVVGENVVIPIEQDGPSRIVALRRSNGEIAWSSPRGGNLTAYATPLFVPDEKGGQIIVSSTASVSAIDATSGEMIWEEKCFADRCVSSPILLEVGNERAVMAGSGKGGKGSRIVAFHLARQLPTGEPRLRWDLTKTIPYCPTPISFDGAIYCALDSGIARCLNATDGGEIWTERVCDKVTASPIELGGNILIVSETGECVWLAAKKSFEVLGRYQLDDEFLATPAFGGGRLLLRGQKYLWCIGEPK